MEETPLENSGLFIVGAEFEYISEADVQFIGNLIAQQQPKGGKSKS
jgi:hypothetical protein